MSKRDLSGALAQTVAGAKKKGSDQKFERAEQYLETEARGASPIAPNAPKKKPPRKKVVRDTFSFPQDDYQDIRRLQDRMIALGHVATKSEALRLGLKVALALNDQDLEGFFLELEKLKPGRPKGS